MFEENIIKDIFKSLHDSEWSNWYGTHELSHSQSIEKFQIPWLVPVECKFG